MTGEHIKYVTNRVIIPQLDFLLQCTVLAKRDYTKVMAPLRQTFKHKSHLNSTISNNVIHSQFLYGLIDFECHHITNMILSLHKQLNNTSILEQLAYISLTYLQLKYWTSDFPLSFIQQSKCIPSYTCLLENIIWSCKSLPIFLQFSPSLNFHITGGLFPLCNIIPNFTKYNKLLRSSNIMFLDQFTSFEGTHLL